MRLAELASARTGDEAAGGETEAGKGPSVGHENGLAGYDPVCNWAGKAVGAGGRIRPQVFPMMYENAPEGKI